MSAAAGSSRRPNSPHGSSSSSRSRKSNRADHRTTEETPLLARRDESPSGLSDHEEEAPRPSAASYLRTLFRRKRSPDDGESPVPKRRWASIVALAFLSSMMIAIIILGFLAPAAVQEYAKEAAVFKPSNVSIQGFSSEGVEARIRGDFFMDGTRVHKKSTRDLGRFGTWVAGMAETSWANLIVQIPEYDNVFLGQARIPPVKVSVREGEVTHVDITSELFPGDVDGIKMLAKRFLNGQLGDVNARATVTTSLKAGWINLGQQTIEEYVPLRLGGHGGGSGGDDDDDSHGPRLPKYNVTDVHFREINAPPMPKGLAADVGVTVENPYPIHMAAPPMAFAVMVEGCSEDDFITIADAETGRIVLNPYRDLNATVVGIVRNIPDSFKKSCPDSDKSPMDRLLTNYLQGDRAKVYVRGSDTPLPETPEWIADILSGVTLGLPLPGRSLGGDLIKNFSLTDMHFKLPNPYAEPDEPESQPRISAKVSAVVAVPKDIDFDIAVEAVRANADVLYHGEKLGELNLDKWQHAESRRNKGPEGQNELWIKSDIKDAPLNVTDDDLFTEVVEHLIFTGKGAELGIRAKVDVKADTPLDEISVRGIPAKGLIHVKPIRRGGGWGTGMLNLHIGNLNIIDTAADSLSIQASLNFTNPTNYTATVPYIDINILTNDTILGHATAKDVSVVPGNNTNVVVQALWKPDTSGDTGLEVGRELLSQYISGLNTTLTFKMHEGSIPNQPGLSKALSKFNITIPTPKLRPPRPPKDDDGDDDDDDDDDGDEEEDDGRPHFITDATMHLLSSSATFTLLSPLTSSTLYINSLEATALYKGDRVGFIAYDIPFPVPPGSTTTPRLPVDWSLGSVGYDAVKNALGGTLRLSAEAEVDLQIGEFKQNVWFKGGGIGANIRL